MGFCCCKRKEDNGEDIQKNFDYKKLREKIKLQIEYLHSSFKNNVEDAIGNDVFYTMEKVKLILSEFSDVTDSKVLANSKSLTDAQFFELDQFLEELIRINKMGNNEKEKGKELKLTIQNYQTYWPSIKN